MNLAGIFNFFILCLHIKGQFTSILTVNFLSPKIGDCNVCLSLFTHTHVVSKKCKKENNFQLILSLLVLKFLMQCAIGVCLN